ncbi:hypothetical protein ZIOFF_058217 [Zingiber officinale]|uniref:Retrovirus-related Pol polyprotein from transposon TNT 1-94-like beta-barrel domain-containing protein n=1 Tax=Zingiber officinale TaxID=94328 RepID=A0A8J5F8I3_ZINOF|nr:hypothetical protein ZIOFF_058217 [Zingiber officinale]
MLEPQSMTGSSLAAKTDSQKKDKYGVTPIKDNKVHHWCNYGKKPRHTKKTSWKLHGKPPSRELENRRGQHKSQAHLIEQSHIESNLILGRFNSAEIEKLRGLLDSLDKLFDSGVTDHMTPNSQIFHTYNLSPSNRQIIVVNGSLAIVAGFGNVHLTPNLILKNILRVPLSANLVFVQKLTTKLHCHVIFFPFLLCFPRSGLGKENWTC